MRLLVTRPELDAHRQGEALAACGHDVTLSPLLAIEAVPDVSLELDDAQALIATSRNALRALASHPQRAAAIRLPLFAVGDATAAAAGALGFGAVTAAVGTGEMLARLIADRLDPNAGPLVHLSGETVAFDLKTALAAKGFAVRQPVLYRAVAAPSLSEEAIAGLKTGDLDGVVLMSPRTAAVFADLVRREGMVTQASRLICYCLSAAVAQAVEPLGAMTIVASEPREEELLALIATETASSRRAES
jgi:uroporphyrinogen-III synthase